MNDFCINKHYQNQKQKGIPNLCRGLYKLRYDGFTFSPPAHIACLVLAATGLGAMAAQIGLRTIGELIDGGDALLVFGFLLGFLWMAGITFCLAKTFIHFTVKFKHEHDVASPGQDTAAAPKGDFNLSNRLDAETFAADLQIDPVTVQDVLHADTDDNMPWYMETFLGFAGVFTAILAILFLGTLLAVTLNIDLNRESRLLLLVGLVVYPCAIFARLNTSGLFPRHFFNTLLMVCGAFAVFGAAWLFDGGIGFILFSMALSALTLWLVRDRILEFLMAAGFAGLLVYALLYFHAPYAFIWLYVVCVVLGIICMTLPLKTGLGSMRQGRVLGAAGAAFLLAPCIFAFFLLNANIADIADQLHLGMSGAWAERIASVIVTAGSVWYLNRGREAGEPMRPPLIIVALLLIAITMMPLGSAAALLLLLAGYILGLRSLTIVGVLAQIGFMVWYYYDMDIMLLNKSMLLMGFGTILLLVYAVTINGGAFKQGNRHV